MFEILPSISITGGRVAKLSSSAFENAKLYEISPLDLALYFQENGFSRIHLVDLDGAQEEQVINYDTLRMISGYTDLDINFSGGIRTDGSAQLAFENGAKTITVASMAVEEPASFHGWMITFGAKKLVLGADVLDGELTSRGRTKKTGLNALEFIERMYNNGARNLKLTDVSLSGVLTGPNYDLVQEVRERFPELYLMVSGGVGTIDHIAKLKDLGANGVIISTAFYEDKLPLDELQQLMA